MESRQVILSEVVDSVTSVLCERIPSLSTGARILQLVSFGRQSAAVLVQILKISWTELLAIRFQVRMAADLNIACTPISEPQLYPLPRSTQPNCT